ncbi:DUF3572 family protein [Croceicoccus ponticola]|uniref:DUF3572 family protein n=1 Tax=Croceicoccus ponticola TaxID=2217664 RepID=A0A437H2I8_9SPHN|nr:DUF3572 family protein [Croceicoccus ponticola]RVQ69693.1 DUF3572 family protein [Croceicoccus ponticola]
MTSGKTPDADSATVALMALSWILQDQTLAERFLDLTGLLPDDLRAGLDRREIQSAILEFLAGNDADLVAAADGLGLAPERIVAARDNLTGRTFEF